MVKNRNGRHSAIFNAAENGHLHEVERLLRDDPSALKATCKYFVGWTPLHYASWKGRTSTADLLIREGADINAKACLQSTPLHIACEEGRASTVELLLLNGADIKAKDNRGMTPLHTASAFGYTSIVELLLSNGADITAKSKTGQTPLDVADKSDIATLLKTHLN